MNATPSTPATAPSPGVNPRFDRLAAALAPTGDADADFRRLVGEALAAQR